MACGSEALQVFSAIARCTGSAGRDAGINWSQLQTSTSNAMFYCKFNLVLAERGYLLSR